MIPSIDGLDCVRVGDRSPRRKVLAIDVCGTLFDANTTAGIVHHHHERMGHSKWCVLLRLLGRRSILSLSMVAIGKFARHDLHRALTIRSLRGESRTALEASANSYVSSLDAVRIDRVHDLLTAMRTRGWTPILASSALDIVVAPIAKRLDVEYVSSRLAWTGNVCAGRLELDLTARKRKFLEEAIGLSLTDIDFAVVTDNRSDQDLIEIARPAHVVVHGRARPAWTTEVDAELIYL